MANLMNLLREFFSSNHSKFYYEGDDAYYAGSSEDMCPYDKGTQAYEDWMRGFKRQ